MTGVHVIFVNYGDLDDLVGSLGSLDRSMNPRVHVHHNGPEPLSEKEIAWIHGNFEGEITLYQSSTNLGFGRAVNRVVAEIDGQSDDVIVVANPDTVFHKGALRELVGAVLKGPEGIYSPQIVTGGPRRFRFWFNGGSLSTWSLRTTMRMRGRPVPVKPVFTLEPCSFLPGAVMVMTCGVFSRLGGFDEKFFLYWEDADFCFRARAIGLRLCVVTGARVWHAVGGSGSHRALSYFYYIQYSRAVFAALIHRGGPSVLFTAGLPQTIRPFIQAFSNRGRVGPSLLLAWRGLIDACRELGKR